jgi:two-component system sensor histidine kinase PilS (NtrC family)
MTTGQFPVGQGWVVFTRLLLPCALLVGVATVPVSVLLWVAVGFYGLVNFLFLAGMVWTRGGGHPGRPMPGRAAWTHPSVWMWPAMAVLLVSEHVLVAGLVMADGSAVSDFALLFVLISTLSGFLFGAIGAVASTSLAFVLLGFVVAGEIGFIPGILAGSVHEARPLVFRWIILTVESGVLGGLTAFLATSLQQQRRLVEGKARDLEMARLDLDGVLNRLSYGVVVVDVADRILYFNSSAVAVLRSPLHPGARLDQIAMNEPWGTELMILVEQIRGGRQEQTERECRSATGAWLRIQVAPTLLEGRLRSLVVTIDDISAIRRMEEEVRNAERMATLGHMAARIAHEIRNPLASITGSSQLLGQNPDLATDDRQLLELIRRESKRLDRILAEFLDYSRTRTPSIREFSPLEVVQEVVEIVRTRAGTMGIEGVQIDIKAVAVAPRIWLDRDMLVQILSNLGINGLQALSKERPGRILIEIESFEGGIRFRVRDNGVGMGPDVLAKMGEAFFTTRQGGVGLGVAISRQLTSLLGGTFRVQSLEGRGTIVEVAFPISSRDTR